MFLKTFSRQLKLKTVFALLSSSVDSILELSLCRLGLNSGFFCNPLQEWWVLVAFQKFKGRTLLNTCLGDIKRSFGLDSIWSRSFWNLNFFFLLLIDDHMLYLERELVLTNLLGKGNTLFGSTDVKANQSIWSCQAVFTSTNLFKARF